MWLTLSLAVFLFYVLSDYLQKKHRNDIFRKANISGPVAIPIVGCAFTVNKVNPENMIKFIGNCFETYGDTFRMWVLDEAMIFTKDIKILEAVYSSSTLLEKGNLYDLFRSWLRDGLLLSIGKKWHSRRKVFTPAFHFKTLEHYVDVFNEQSAIMVKQLEKYANGKTVVDVFPIVCLAALDVITEAAMGVKVNAQLDPEFPYTKALKSVVDIQPGRMLNFLQRYDFSFKLLFPKSNKLLKQNIQIMHDFTIKVIEERRQALERSIAAGTYKPIALDDSEVGTKRQMALLDILLQSKIDGKPLSNMDIMEEVDTFMFEGDDTTTSAVSHGLYRIARYPEVQKKLLQEIVEIVGKDKEQPISMAQLNDLKYMDCVAKEVMRLHPPVPGVGRKLHSDVDLNGITLPGNTSVYMINYFSHRDAKTFANPEDFEPDRFLDDSNGSKRSAFAYTPFSAGPKNCIGQKFAMLEFKTMISKVLRHYELLPLGADIQTSFNFILRSTTGAHIGLRPRIY